jgi:hypothetical protein
MNMKQAVEEATIAMNLPSPSKKSPVKRKKIKSESNQQQQPLGNMDMPFGQQQQQQKLHQLPPMPALIPNQNAQNIQYCQNMGMNNVTQPLHQFNNQSQPASISIQANHVTVLPATMFSTQQIPTNIIPISIPSMPTVNTSITKPTLPSMTLFYKNHQNMGKPLGNIDMPLGHQPPTPPSSVQEDDLNLLLQEGLNTTSINTNPETPLE